jgi:hypothetical protein
MEHYMFKNHIVIAITACALFATTAHAQQGPVAQACKADIAKYCAGLGHGDRQTRTCLEKNKDKVSEACRTALETTGGGRGRNR